LYTAADAKEHGLVELMVHDATQVQARPFGSW
jgi:hypothetical protein